MKTCSKCKENKPKAEFRKDKSRADELNVSCKQCLNAIYRDRYEDRYKTNALRHARLRHKKHKGLIEKFLENKQCLICGEDERCALDFHHLDENEKDFTISGNHQRAWKRILNEIEKCIVLCATCHRKRHWGSLKDVDLTIL